MSLPFNEKIVFIKSTQKEECGSLGYILDTQIYLGDQIFDKFESKDIREKFIVESLFWHELFHSKTKANKTFRKDVYKIIHFTIMEKDFKIPKSIYEISNSNPDVEYHDSYATFKINGKDIDCYMVLTASEPFANPGDNFFDCIQFTILPIDSKDEFIYQKMLKIFGIYLVKIHLMLLIWKNAWQIILVLLY